MQVVAISSGLDWRADVLGDGYEQAVLPLLDDDEGPVVATLVRRAPSGPARRAVLYVHGFVDYFFQTALADFWDAQGFDFYALDLRKSGRSLLPHQTPYFFHDVSDCYEELDLVARLLRDELGHPSLTVNAHSTGGLITALWANDRKDLTPLEGLVLNSPFLDLNAAPAVRTVGADVLNVVGHLKPYAVLPLGLNDLYGRSISAQHEGEWVFDVAWKPVEGVPVRAGWLGAVHRAHRRVHRGVEVGCPVLVLASTRSIVTKTWHEHLRSADAVLDVEHIARWSTSLGRHVTCVRIDGGLHDLVLSAAPVRERVYAEMAHWLSAYLPA